MVISTFQQLVEVELQVSDLVVRAVALGPASQAMAGLVFSKYFNIH